MSDNDRVRALVADKEPFYRSYVGRTLAGAGFAVSEAGSDAEALTLILGQRNRPNVLLMDTDLPSHGAAELLPILREQFSGEELPIMILTLDARSPSLAELRELGADGVLQKQAPGEHVVYRVRQLVALPDRERRIAPRCPVDAPVCFEAEGISGVGRMVDIGTGGLQLQTLAPPPAREQTVRLRFVFSADDEVYEVRGRVTRQAPLRFSVAFQDLDERTAEAIEAVLASY